MAKLTVSEHGREVPILLPFKSGNYVVFTKPLCFLFLSTSAPDRAGLPSSPKSYIGYPRSKL